MSSMRRMVSIEVAINNAVGDMFRRDQRMRPTYMRWAEDAERKIGSFYSLKRKYFTLSVNADCHRVDLPCGVEAIMGVMLGGISDCNCDAVFRNAYNYGAGATYFYVGMDRSYYGGDMRQWEVQDGQIVFLSPLTGISEITIDAAYRPMDAAGKFLMVLEDHVDAIGAYIKMMQAEGMRWGPNKMSIYDMEDLRKEWGRARREARGNASDPSPSEYAEIAAMINDPLSGWGGCMLRYPDEFKYTWGTL